MSETNKDPSELFELEKKERISQYSADMDWCKQSRSWMRRAFEKKYMYNFTWMGRPIIQSPIDMVAMQELIWAVRPQIIVETGVAHGGSLVFYASLLELLGGEGEVIGIDIDIRAHNRKAIEEHPMSKRLCLIEGSSVDPEVVEQVRARLTGKQRVMVILDSNHSEQHVLAELDAYSGFVTKDSYLVVFDSVVEDLPKGFFSDRPWDVGNNPKTAVRKWLPENPDFIVDSEFESKLLLTVCPEGFLKRVVG